MDADSQKIIREILSGLGLTFDEPIPGRPRFKITACVDNVARKVFFNIPKNKKFVFQLIFENGNIDRALRGRLAVELRALFGGPYPVGGGSGKSGYLTIYLPDNEHILITTGNRVIITTIIKREVDRVCKGYKSLLLKG